jgi:hypothetical protein
MAFFQGHEFGLECLARHLTESIARYFAHLEDPIRNSLRHRLAAIFEHRGDNDGRIPPRHDGDPDLFEADGIENANGGDVLDVPVFPDFFFDRVRGNFHTAAIDDFVDSSGDDEKAVAIQDSLSPGWNWSAPMG